mgnify:CR=1 FL=1
MVSVWFSFLFLEKGSAMIKYYSEKVSVCCLLFTTPNALQKHYFALLSVIKANNGEINAIISAGSQKPIQ